MKLPLRTNLLARMPYFELIFSSRFENFIDDFVLYYNHALDSDPNEVLEAYHNYYNVEEDIQKKIIIHNLGCRYFQYQKKYWSKRPQAKINVLPWEKCYETELPTYNEIEDLKRLNLTTPKNRKEKTLIQEPDYNEEILTALDLLFVDNTVPRNLLSGFCLSIMITYYNHTEEIESWLEKEDNTRKLL